MLSTRLPDVQPRTGVSSRVGTVIAIVVAFAATGLAAVIGFQRLDLTEVWVDEVVYARAGLAYMGGDFALNPEHPPLGKLIIGAWQLIAGEGVVSARALMGVVAIATATAIWWFAARISGPRWAVAPAAMWVLMLHTFEGRDRLDRLVSLDMLMVFFLVVGFACAWRWWETRAWWWALLTGGVFAAAVMVKLPAAVFVPALIVLLIAKWRGRDLLVGIAAMAGAALAVTVLCLAPVGYIDAIVAMVEFQGEHNATGHSVLINDQVYPIAPWWSTFTFAYEGIGLAGAAALGIGTVSAAILVRPRRVVAMLLTALGLSLTFLVFVSNVALPHYYLDWVWIPTILTGLALPALFRDRRLVPVAGVVTIALAVSMIANIQFVLSREKTGLVAAAEILERAGALDEPVLVQGIAPSLAIGEHIPSAVGEVGWPGLRGVVVGSDPRQAVAPEVADLIEAPPPGVTVHDVGGLTVLTFEGELDLVEGKLTLAP